MRTVTLLSLTSTLMWGAAPTAAQGLISALVTDTSGDTIWSCIDANADGDYDEIGEVTPFYDDTTGAVQLTNNTSLLRSADGIVWVSDSTEDVIVRLEDGNGNGNALDPGEATIWFDGTAGNSSGVELGVPRGMWRDADGVLWVASGDSGFGGNDAIIRLQDLNSDGDANDAMEQLEYATFAPNGPLGESVPTAVVRGADGAIYYTDSGGTGVIARGVYRLEDLDGSGVIDQPGENQVFFIPTALSGNNFYWDLAIDSAGRFYIADSVNDVIWRFEDTDASGSVDPLTEAAVIFTAPGSSWIWDISLASDGTIYAVEDEAPDRLLRLVDLNADGLFDGPGEVTTIYDEMTAATNIGSPTGIVLIEGDLPIGQSECGPAATNSSGFSATVQAFGSTSVTTNDVLLRTQGMSLGSWALFIVSEDANFVMNPGGSQGNLCIGGEIGRYVFDLKNTGVTGSVELRIDTTFIPQPQGAEAVAPGDTWRFQVWFRDANPMLTSNFTDAVAIDFVL